MDEYEKEILKYYCAEKNKPLDEELAETQEFKDYVIAWSNRGKKAAEIKMHEYENRLVSLVKEMIDNAKKGIEVRVEVEDGQRKPFLKTIRSYLRATEGNTSLDRYIKIKEKSYIKKEKK